MRPWDWDLPGCEKRSRKAHWHTWTWREPMASGCLPAWQRPCCRCSRPLVRTGEHDEHELMSSAEHGDMSDMSDGQGARDHDAPSGHAPLPSVGSRGKTALAALRSHTFRAGRWLTGCGAAPRRRRRALQASPPAFSSLPSLPLPSLPSLSFPGAGRRPWLRCRTWLARCTAWT